MRHLQWPHLPRSLFGRTLLTLIVSFGLLALLTFFIVVHYALAPVAKRSATDLAAFMVVSAQSWIMLAPEQRQAFADRLLAEHRILVTRPDEPIADNGYFLPYVVRVEQALEQRLGFAVPVRNRLEQGRRWFFADFWIEGQALRVGFPRDRVATRPLDGAILLILLGLALILFTAALLARRITAPLIRLSRAAEQMARGHSPEPLPETGVRELACLSREFNHMAREVRELLANRTILLAGISHDLRTPLTRLRLALEMLPEAAEPTLVGRMERDLEQMNGLIGQALELGRNLEAGERTRLELGALIDDLTYGCSRVRWRAPAPCPCRVNEYALRRVLANLLENALRYSAEAPVELQLICDSKPAEIRVLDRGPGIPDAQKEAVFRPFFRLEQSRNRETGGSGLGLAVARQLAAANGLQIRLANRGGGGTVASVILPADDLG